MQAQSVQLHLNMRVWQDERLGRLWRMSYDDGDGETVVTFPDTAAMGDFIAERLGLTLEDELQEEALGR
ncbi:MAG: hypothetical protein MUD01_07745 [Chloroflexaceae bacterium]|nr:hypothetical protein [Chloroflexaceae bacterium]